MDNLEIFVIVFLSVPRHDDDNDDDDWEKLRFLFLSCVFTKLHYLHLHVYICFVLFKVKKQTKKG